MRTPVPDSKAEPGGPATAVVRSRFPAWLIAAFLALLTIAAFWPATGGDFINFDDPVYVTSNPHVQGGLNWESVKWACSNPVLSNWHPVTVLAHTLVCQVFGLKPWGHHFTNVLFHGLNAALVFLLLRQMTGATWRSVSVAALFAVHPLRVESVAWVSELKDVLSGFFGLLALIFYARYAQAQTPKPEGHGPSSVAPLRSSISHFPAPCFYLLSLSFFALGLMSKPMLVTLPCVMLVLDYWPLDRFKPRRAGRLVREKIPFFAFAAAASVVTFSVQKQDGAVAAADILPLGARAANALISYCRYPGKLFWPADFAIFYPYPRHWPAEKVLLAAGFVLGISGLCLLWRRQAPFLLVGWLWFCGMLVPVIGLVQVGGQAMADRYTYLPSLGLLVMVVWGACRWTTDWYCRVAALSVAAAAAISLCAALTWQQLKYWQDSESLFRHALSVTQNNWVAHNNLGIALENKGRIEEALAQFQEAVRLEPNLAGFHLNLGLALEKEGQTEAAFAQFQETVRLDPNDADAHLKLGVALGKKGQIGEAMRLKPDHPEARDHLGNALARRGDTDAAIKQFQESIRLKPDNPKAHENLGIALGMKGEIDAAISQFQEAIRLKPDYVAALNNLGYWLAKRGENLDQARSVLERALRFEPKSSRCNDTMALVLFKLKRPREALDYQLKAVDNAALPEAAIFSHLGDIYAALNLRDQAAEAWRKSLAVEPNAQIQSKLGDVPGPPTAGR